MKYLLLYVSMSAILMSKIMLRSTRDLQASLPESINRICSTCERKALFIFNYKLYPRYLTPSQRKVLLLDA